MQSKQMKEIQNTSFKLLKLSYMVVGKIKDCEDSIHTESYVIYILLTQA